MWALTQTVLYIKNTFRGFILVCIPLEFHLPHHEIPQPLAYYSTITGSQMVAIKSCKNDFGYNDTVCYNLNSEEWYDQNVEVSIELNHFNVYTTLMTSIFPIFLSFYLGAWADLFGRKPLFYLVLAAYFLSQCVTTVCAYFIGKTNFWFKISPPDGNHLHTY